jgi:hypothetical protein
MTTKIIAAWLVAMAVLVGVTLNAQPTKRGFTATQSGGNCVYIVDGKYANFIAVVPVGPAGC